MSTQQFRREFSSPYPTKNGTRVILSVDDEPGILVSRQLILEKEGYEVLSASDGEQALRIFAEQPVDLVLLDYVMPGMDGGVVAHEMKRSKPGVPIFMVSASPIPPEAFGCIECRIAKGQGVAELLERIAQLFITLSTRNQASRLADDSPEGEQTGTRNRSSSQGITGRIRW